MHDDDDGHNTVEGTGSTGTRYRGTIPVRVPNELGVYLTGGIVNRHAPPTLRYSTRPFKTKNL